MRAALFEFASPAAPASDTAFRAWYQDERIPSLLAIPGCEQVDWFAATPIVFGFPRPPIDHAYLAIARFTLPDDVALAALAASAAGRATPAGASVAARAFRECVARQVSSQDVPGAIIIVFSDPVPGREADYHRWYGVTHIPERLVRPAFIACTVFEAAGAAATGAWAVGHSHLAPWEIGVDNAAAFETVARGAGEGDGGAPDTPTDALDWSAGLAQGYLRVGGPYTP